MLSLRLKPHLETLTMKAIVLLGSKGKSEQTKE